MAGIPSVWDTLLNGFPLGNDDRLLATYGSGAPSLPTKHLEFFPRSALNHGPGFPWLAGPLFLAQCTHFTYSYTHSQNLTSFRLPIFMWPIISFLKCLCVECRVFRERLTFLWFTLDHTPEATLILKEILGDQYHASSEPAFSVLWRNYHLCQFVEDHGQ